ncbi:hypothetical protein [Nonomuraea diastatica]|uniref:hypothetical protein n=1 Tax=Nonomuraea diastatica TaxID=1848329 RepID=UPI001C705FAC|nr:hypothetical protein [Nonomuraea diastatica]
MVENVRRAVMEGQCSVPSVGSVVAGTAPLLPCLVVDADGAEVEPVSGYLRYLMLGDVSPLTCRSYGFGLLRWYRLLWFLQTSWDTATEAEVAVLVGWLREARNPQRLRRRPGSPPAGSVNLKTGKSSLRAGYAPRTINHNLTVISSFYGFHARVGAGPVVNPVPASRETSPGSRAPFSVGAGADRPPEPSTPEGACSGTASDSRSPVGRVVRSDAL